MLDKLFVYGSLRTGMFNYKRLIENEVKSRQAGNIKGILYHIENKGYPADKEGSGKIVGELMTFKNYETSIRKMDELEHYFEDRPESCEYIRKIVSVSLDVGGSCEAYFYHYNPKSFYNKADQLIPIPSGDWKSYIENK